MSSYRPDIYVYIGTMQGPIILMSSYRTDTYLSDHDICYDPVLHVYILYIWSIRDHIGPYYLNVRVSLQDIHIFIYTKTVRLITIVPIVHITACQPPHFFKKKHLKFKFDSFYQYILCAVCQLQYLLTLLNIEYNIIKIAKITNQLLKMPRTMI